MWKTHEAGDLGAQPSSPHHPPSHCAVWVWVGYGNTAQPLGIMVNITYLLWPLHGCETKWNLKSENVFNAMGSINAKQQESLKQKSLSEKWRQQISTWYPYTEQARSQSLLVKTDEWESTVQIGTWGGRSSTSVHPYKGVKAPMQCVHTGAGSESHPPHNTLALWPWTSHWTCLCCNSRLRMGMKLPSLFNCMSGMAYQMTSCV